MSKKNWENWDDDEAMEREERIKPRAPRKPAKGKGREILEQEGSPTKKQPWKP